MQRRPPQGRTVLEQLERLEPIRTHLPELLECGFLMNLALDGTLHEDGCPRDVRGPGARFQEAPLREILAGTTGCRACAEQAVAQGGSVAAILEELSEPLLSVLPLPEGSPARRTGMVRLMFAGSNRVMTEESLRRLVRDVIIPEIGNRPAVQDRCLVAYTAGDIHFSRIEDRPGYMRIVEEARDGLLHVSAARGLYVTAVDPAAGMDRAQSTHRWGSLLDDGDLDGDELISAFETLGVFCDDALSGACSWRPVERWWETSVNLELVSRAPA